MSMIGDFTVAGTDFSLTEESGNKFSINPTVGLTLPVALVSGLSSASYGIPSQKQAILDALSPFQIVSKQWSMMAAQVILESDDQIEDIVFVGSWFGQQSAMMCRFVRNYRDYEIKLVDKDPDACKVANFLLHCDSYHQRCSPEIVNKNVFELDFGPNTLFMWTGLEHFDPKEVEEFLNNNSESTFVFQSTSMKADDHINVANHVDDILNSVPEDWAILYKGEIAANLGSRYLLVARGPGTEDFVASEDDPD